MTQTPSTGNDQTKPLSGLTRLYRLDFLLICLFLTLVVSEIILRTKLNYPASLLDPLSFAHSFVERDLFFIVIGFTMLLLAGYLFINISLCLAPLMPGEWRKRLTSIGTISGGCWILCGLAGYPLIIAWNTTTSSEQFLFALFILLSIEIFLSALLAYWMSILIRQIRIYRIMALLAISGPILACLRSTTWLLNGILLSGSGWYVVAGILDLLALLGQSIWLLWLLRLGFWFFRHHNDPRQATQSQQREKVEKLNRRAFFTWGAKIGGSLAGGGIALAYTGWKATNTPILESDDVPTVPSTIGSLYHLLMLTFLHIFPVRSISQMQNEPTTPSPLPPGNVLEEVDASGVPSQLVYATGASKKAVILLIHSGAFTAPLTDAYRQLAAKLSQITGASVLLPEYRLTPDHPFPAGLQDCVTAYRWLREQGASQIVIMGDSAGGNLTLATALSLRDDGDMLPAALIAIGAATDLTMSGETHTTNAAVDPLLANGLAKDAFAVYTGNGTVDLRNPLVSPLYADVTGLPPTLFQVGTQEILLSDSTRMAQRMQQARIDVKLQIWPGMWHVWHLTGDTLPEARLAVQHIATYIRQHLYK